MIDPVPVHIRYLKCGVIDACSNDYESVESVGEQVLLWASKEYEGITLEHIHSALTDCFAEGLIAAYEYVSRESAFTRIGKLEFDSATYISATDAGKNFSGQ